MRCRDIIAITRLKCWRYTIYENCVKCENLTILMPWLLADRVFRLAYNSIHSLYKLTMLHCCNRNTSNMAQFLTVDKMTSLSPPWTGRKLFANKMTRAKATGESTWVVNWSRPIGRNGIYASLMVLSPAQSTVQGNNRWAPSLWTISA